MKLATVPEFRARCFTEESRPDPRTVRRWVREGEIPGRVIGGITYVDLDAWANTTGNELADRVLRGEPA